ncbi:universal stress protein [Marinobacter adhaerens]|uniref:Universal stress protein n=1 Tax=Marinobacter adhaerens TaxID=1033846 RepID=A0A851HQS3_9GAMM|nr:universal stress protein [Marinobacter adhaerens]NWN91363.1 universal stress protein [Marinobacter adhaerens]
MYSKILVPVDLAHTDQMWKALNIAIDLAQKYNAALCYITITNSAPSSAAGNPKELEQKLDTFAREQGKSHGIDTESIMVLTADTSVELERRILDAIESTGADLVIMDSHVPGIGDRLRFIRSNSANVVKNSSVSVFVVR